MTRRTLLVPLFVAALILAPSEISGEITPHAADSVNVARLPEPSPPAPLPEGEG